MVIIHKIDNFLLEIFPELIGALAKSFIINILENYYTFASIKPRVSINDDFVKIKIDTSSILAQEIDFQKVVSFCEKGKYSEAKPILKKLIEKNPIEGISKEEIKKLKC